eukprot:346242-Hanusia_phi.AAC.1
MIIGGARSDSREVPTQSSLPSLAAWHCGRQWRGPRYGTPVRHRTGWHRHRAGPGPGAPTRLSPINLRPGTAGTRDTRDRGLSRRDCPRPGPGHGTVKSTRRTVRSAAGTRYRRTGRAAALAVIAGSGVPNLQH